jgi:monoterpene epsilon-lactone hydrolase
MGKNKPPRSGDIPPLRSGVPASDELRNRRSLMSAHVGAVPETSVVDEVFLGDVRSLVCDTQDPRATLLWFHGGGFRLGSADHSAPFGVRLAAATSSRVVLVDYALAPEHPFPAALHDAIHAFEDAERHWSDCLFVGGDSAGGGLAASLTLVLLRNGATSPRGVVLMSPWCDLMVTADSYAANAKSDPLFSASSASESAALYLQGWDATDPLVSPLRAQLAQFPPTLIFASTDEVLLDDARTLTSSLSDAGTEVTAHFVPGVNHVWPTLDPEHPASVAALEQIDHFVARWKFAGGSSAS